MTVCASWMGADSVYRRQDGATLELHLPAPDACGFWYLRGTARRTCAMIRLPETAQGSIPLEPPLHFANLILERMR